MAGLQKEGAVGLLKGTGKGLVGLLVRPTGGLVDLASGTLDFVTRYVGLQQCCGVSATSCSEPATCFLYC